ncbi:MAG: hypothetical protein ACI3ZD_16185 [Prevotella sp.]
MNRRIFVVATLMLLVVMSLASCSDDNDEKIAGKGCRQLTVVFSTGGLGDNGYNDKIMQGVISFAGSHADVETHILRPQSLDEARKIYSDWLSRSAQSNDSSLIVFASSEYADVVKASASSPSGNNTVMLFESGGKGIPDGIITAKLQRYGASYLAGAMVSEDQAILVLAMEGDEMVDDAAKGFTDGHQSHSPHKLHRLVLANDYTGFNMPLEAYRMVDSIYVNDKPEDENQKPLWSSSRSFSHIYSVVGGSNVGVRQLVLNCLYSVGLIGIDNDLSELSNLVSFSVVLESGKLISDYIKAWYEGREIKSHAVYGLDSEYVRIAINPNASAFFNDDYYEEDVFPKRYDKYINEAKEKEAEYENK